MVWSLPCCDDTIMTALAGTNGLRMVDAGDWQPRGDGMTGIAGIGCVDMIGVLAACNRAIVTTLACANDVIMIDACSRHPLRHAMTAIAVVR